MSVATPNQTASREVTNRTTTAASAWANRLETAGIHTIRYGLVLVLLWIGGMKFTAYEAEGISGFVANSPLMSWAYQVATQRQLSAILGLGELLIAVMISVRPLSARISAIGSALAVGMFLTTLSFLLSTPGVIESSLGFPGLSVIPGQFLLKDVILLGAAILTAGEALQAFTADRGFLANRGSRVNIPD